MFDRMIFTMGNKVIFPPGTPVHRSELLLNRSIMKIVNLYLGTLMLASVSLNSCGRMPDSNSEKKPNILFIAIDDMNDWTGFLGGHPQASTPNLDKIAVKGMLFTNAHCSAPGCSPSRNSLLYGVEPFKSGSYAFYGEKIHDQLMDQYISLPRFFMNNGYKTFGAGKIHHGLRDDSLQWNEYFKENPGKKIFKEGEGFAYNGKMSFRPTFNPDKDHVDFQVASYGIDVLKREHDKPFLLAVGIVKPHLPFDCPARFFDGLPEHIEPPAILKEDLIDLPTEGNSFRRAGDDRLFKKDSAWEDVRRAYLACISWADFNIGRVLDELAKSPYAENTIVVIWSDHGYHLGERMSFRKFTLWEEATRVPFVIYDPRESNQTKGRRCSQSVSLINMYRTLADMARLKPPNYVDGESLVPQMKDPQKPLKKPTITTWGRENYAVRTKDWRYIRYFDGAGELYDHTRDENEWHNLANDPEYQSIRKELDGYLPENGVLLIEEDIALWSVEGADKARLKK